MTSASALGRTVPAARATSATGLVAVAGFACLVVALQQTLVVPAVPLLPTVLGTTPGVVSWAVTATLLTGAAATPIMGRLSDLVGKRRIMLIAMTVVLTGSLLAPLGGVATVILGRALQGIGTALVPVAMAQMRDALPHHKIPSAMAILSSLLGVGGGIGIPLGGVVLNALGWQAMFWISAALSVVSIVLIRAVLPADHADDAGSVDVAGSVLLTVGLLALLMGISQGGQWGWGDAKTLAALLLGIVVLVGWGLFELRQDSPIVDLRVSGTQALLYTNLASLLLGVLMFTNLLFTTQQLQAVPGRGGFGWSAAAAGIAMLPNALGMLLVAPLSARLAQRFSPRLVLQLGAASPALLYLLRAFVSTSAVLVIVWATLIGIGIGFGYAALPMLISEYAPLREMGSANGVNALLRAVGTAVASAGVATLVAAMSFAQGGRRFPEPQAFTTIALIAAGLSLLTLVVATFARARGEHRGGASVAA